MHGKHSKFRWEGAALPGERKNKNVKDNRKGRRQKSLQTKDGQKKQEAGMDERLGRNGRNEDEREGGR